MSDAWGALGRRWFGPTVVAAAVLVALGTAVSDPTARVVGSATVDGFGTQWFYWFAGEVLAGRQPAGHTDLLFHPWGKDVYAHTGGNLVDAWAAWPLRAAFGAVLGYNLWVALLLATNAWAGVRLAEALGVGPGGRWPAAVALVLNPYVLGELDLGRPTQAWLAPAGFALARLLAMRRAREGVAAGFWLAITALTYWYYGLLLAGAAAVVGLGRLAAGPERRRVATANAVAATVACAGALPFALPMLHALDAGVVPGLLALDGTGPLAPLALRTVEGDEQGLYVVAVLQAAAGSLLDDGGLRFNPGIPALFGAHLLVGVVGTVVLARRAAGDEGGGVVPAAAMDGAGGALRGGTPPSRPAAAAGLRGRAAAALRAAAARIPASLGTGSLRDASGVRPKSHWTWSWVLVLLLGSLIVASGPAFVVGERLVANRPWIALVAEVDALRRWWWPGRAVFLAHLVLAPLLAVVVGAVPGGLRRALVAVVLLAALLLPLRREALLPVASWDAAVPRALACLAEAPPGAVIDVPLLVDQKNLWFQTVHGHPILGGMLLKKAAFAPAGFTAFRAEDPLARALEAVGEKQYTRDVAPATEAERAALVGRGYRYVVARIGAFGRARGERDGSVTWVSEWSRPRRQLLALLGPPAMEDEDLAIWTLDGAPLPCEGAAE